MASSMRGGGSEKQTAWLARALPRDQFEPHLYLTEHAGELLDEIPGDVPIHCPPESIGQPCCLPDRLRLRLPGEVLRRQAAWLKSCVLGNAIDVIYDRTFHMSMIAGHRNADAGIPRVSTIVSPPDMALPSVEKRFVWLKRRLLASAYRRSRDVVAVSDVAARSAESFYGLASRSVSVIVNPIDVESVVSKSESSPRSDLPSVPGARRLVCVGRMSQEKGQSDLLVALSLAARDLPDGSPPLALRFVGDGPDRDSLLALSEMLTAGQSAGDNQGDATDSVRYSIQQCGVIVPALGEIVDADILVLPSRFEGMPNAVLEAFALGTPVIATRSGGTVELQVSDDRPTCFWADPCAPHSMRDAILRWVHEPEAAVRHVANAREILRRNHDPQQQLAKICGLLSR